MNILMCTNTYAPHVGGVARSVDQFSNQFRDLGHRVVVIAPQFSNTPDDEIDVIRMPALQQFNGTDFSVPIPIPGYLDPIIDEFQPHLVHSHHPFLLGDTALRISAAKNIPVVFTHHTQYERYTHYVPGDSELMKRFVIQLAVGYCNLCDAVIAPSNSIRLLLIEQGVTTEIDEIPTGVDTSIFGTGKGSLVRRQTRIPSKAFVIGHVGRLAPEKSLDFLAGAVAKFVATKPDVWFLVAGSGPSEETMRLAFDAFGIMDRLVMLGSLERSELANVYAAMDVFVFASQSETQGMVLTEAMAAGTPVVAVDAPGVREVLRDFHNGRLLDEENQDNFINALQWIHALPANKRRQIQRGARETAEDFSLPGTANQMLQLYERLLKVPRRTAASNTWSEAARLLAEEWRIWSNAAGAATHAIFDVS